jgi:hypothetical protein
MKASREEEHAWAIQNVLTVLEDRRKAQLKLYEAQHKLQDTDMYLVETILATGDQDIIQNCLKPNLPMLRRMLQDRS